MNDKKTPLVLVDRETLEIVLGKDHGLASAVARLVLRQSLEKQWINTAEPGERIHVALSDPEMQRAYDAGEPFKTPDELRIDELERALAGMLFAYDDGVGQDWSAPLLDSARKLVKAEEFKG